MSNTEHKNREIERKFLVKNDGFLKESVKAFQIEQGYICRQPGKTVRVRIRDNQAFLTIKGKRTDNGLTRFEWEKEIDKDDALQLLQLCEGATIKKTRHLVPNGPFTIEVDVFHGDNEGLVVAEIELEDENDRFDIPQWLGEEVTDDKRYHNSQLVNHPFKNWK